RRIGDGSPFEVAEEVSFILNHVDSQWNYQVWVCYAVWEGFRFLVQFALMIESKNDRNQAMRHLNELFESDFMMAETFIDFAHFVSYSLTNRVRDEGLLISLFSRAKEWFQKTGTPNPFLIRFSHFLAWHIRFFISKSVDTAGARIINA